MAPTRVLRFRTAVFVIGLLAACASSRAESPPLPSPELLQRAGRSLAPGTLVREFCRECGWLAYHEWRIGTSSIESHVTFSDVQLDGKPASLDRLFVRAPEQTGVWRAVSQVLELPSSHPESLEGVPPETILRTLEGVWIAGDATAERSLGSFRLVAGRGSLEGRRLGSRGDADSLQVRRLAPYESGDYDVRLWVSSPQREYRGRLHANELMLRTNGSLADGSHAKAPAVYRYTRVARHRHLVAGEAGTWSVASFYPQFEANAKPFSELNGDLAAAGEAWQKDIAAGYAKLRRPTEFDHLLPFWETRAVEVVFFRWQAISLSTREAGYTGGAHGYASEDFATFVLRNGHPAPVSLLDCLRPGQEVRAGLDRLVDSAIAGPQRTEVLGRWKRQTAESRSWSRFSLQDDGDVVLVVFDGPEVAPEAFITLQRKALAPLLDPSGPLGFLVGRRKVPPDHD